MSYTIFAMHPYCVASGSGALTGFLVLAVYLATNSHHLISQSNGTVTVRNELQDWWKEVAVACFDIVYQDLSGRREGGHRH
jgi:hypothetical protein